jgi:hypothetical protein
VPGLENPSVAQPQSRSTESQTRRETRNVESCKIRTVAGAPTGYQRPVLDEARFNMSGLQLLTITHVAISLAAIASGFIVLFGLLADRRLELWIALFLATTVATSVTGFVFPYHGFTPGIGIGILSILVLAVSIYAYYARHLAGAWRRVYVITAVIALYFNFFVLIVQSFQKVPALKALAPTQTELPFALANIVALVAFIVLGTLAVKRFREVAAIKA